MKTKDGFMMRKVGERAVVVAVGETARQFHGMINLNGTGAFLWELLNQDTTEEKLIQAMTETYEIDREGAKEGVQIFLDKLRSAKVLEE